MFFNNRKCGYDMPMNNCPIMEPTIEKCVQKDIYHEVEQVSPFM